MGFDTIEINLVHNYYHRTVYDHQHPPGVNKSSDQPIRCIGNQPNPTSCRVINKFIAQTNCFSFLV